MGKPSFPSAWGGKTGTKVCVLQQIDYSVMRSEECEQLYPGQVDGDKIVCARGDAGRALGRSLRAAFHTSKVVEALSAVD